MQCRGVTGLAWNVCKYWEVDEQGNVNDKRGDLGLEAGGDIQLASKARGSRKGSVAYETYFTGRASPRT